MHPSASQNTVTNRRERLTLGAAMLIMVFCLSLATMDAIEVWNARDRDMRAAESETANLLEAVGSHVQDTFDVAAAMLVGAAHRVVADGIEGDKREPLDALLRAEIDTARPRIRSLAVMAPDGTLVADSAPIETQRHYDDREYFQYHQQHPGAGLHIGPPILSRSDHLWILTLSRRVERRDGTLLAIAIATIEIDYFRTYYETFDIGPNGAILLANADGTMLVRRPFVDANVGRDMSNGSLFREYLPKAPYGVALTASSTDGVVRLNSYRRLNRYPLVVAAALAQDDILADWSREARIHLAGNAALLLLTLSLGIWVVMEFRHRLRTERRAAQSAADYRLLADNSSDPILRLTLDGICRYASPACRSLFGMAPEDFTGTNIIGLLSSSDQAPVRALLRQLAEEQERATIVIRARGIDRAPLQLEANMQRIRTEDGTLEIVAVLRDITERQAVAAALQTARDEAVNANLAKSTFLATVSHEIRTPMNGILGFADVLLRSDLGPDQRRAATLIQDSGNSLLAILNDVLDLSKIEAGRLELERMPVCLPALADGAVSILRSQAEAKNLSLRLELATDLPDWIEGDPTRLRQILLNLLSNALKFTDRGGVSLAITRVGNHLRFAVSDTGIGIGKSQQSQLFKQFSQLHRSTGRQFGGTGLGLAISKRLVEAMPDGEIGVESDEGRGAIFWFEVALPATVAPAPTAPSDGIEPAPAACAHILVAEDLFINQAVIESILLDAGHTVRFANNGREAVEAAGRESFDLILMDMEMPELDGIGATREIRQMSNAMNQVPIIAVTANALESEARRCREAGMNDHLTKPIDRLALLAVIDRWVAAKTA
ncbi:MAG TPA: ATP-binding protein [Aliidongia sp.]|uniref:ATP-binding protein n=1 Tax=Aliidongia sp. TaxID=1914230 RepID=UPI002DDD1F07|nr:ATP-binding protein [Aliidongia sp.]HEV2676983.1 ATP-binding protein [Aliidongia sp.]